MSFHPPNASFPTRAQNGHSRNGRPHPQRWSSRTPRSHRCTTSPSGNASGTCPSMRSSSVEPLRPVPAMNNTRGRTGGSPAGAAGSADPRGSPTLDKVLTRKHTSVRRRRASVPSKAGGRGGHRPTGVVFSSPGSRRRLPQTATTSSKASWNVATRVEVTDHEPADRCRPEVQRGGQLVDLRAVQQHLDRAGSAADRDAHLEIRQRRRAISVELIVVAGLRRRSGSCRFPPVLA